MRTVGRVVRPWRAPRLAAGRVSTERPLSRAPLAAAQAGQASNDGEARSTRLLSALFGGATLAAGLAISTATPSADCEAEPTMRITTPPLEQRGHYALYKEIGRGGSDECCLERHASTSVTVGCLCAGFSVVRLAKNTETGEVCIVVLHGMLVVLAVADCGC